MPPRPDPAAVVEQTQADLTPGRIRSVEIDRVQPLDFDAAGSPGAFHPQHRRLYVTFRKGERDCGFTD
jgi:hypothetical protein